MKTLLVSLVLLVSTTASAQTGSTPIKCGLGLAISALQGLHLKDLKRISLAYEETLYAGDAILEKNATARIIDYKLSQQTDDQFSFSFIGYLEKANKKYVPISGQINFDYQNQFNAYGERLPATKCSAHSIEINNAHTQMQILTTDSVSFVIEEI